MTEEIERLTIVRSSSHDIQKAAMAEGMRDLRADGLTKAAQGQTSIAEVMRVAV